ncbi:MAG TPA: UvrD-helicase domain-containing protein [Verrucomicrobiota bacterium]|nr:DNA helicase UvrD [Verrucomicrobiales bacterium]HRI12073.1 UvrD-helicase domain-containing protein [Verrucomicrobiota bacterium]
MPRDYQLLPASNASVTLRIDYAAELNPQQLAAVTSSPGPALVLAGAGAGKTRTLTYRVAWLLEHAVSPDRILLLTFTNKSAREMMQRVTDLVGSDVSRLWGGTFHSVGLRVLRRHADRLGFRAGFSVADRDDTKDLLAACITDAGIDVKLTRFPKPEVLGEIYSMAANTGQSVDEVIEQSYESFSGAAEEIAELHTQYVSRKRAAGLMDFDDLLTLWLRLLRQEEDLREFYQRRFQFILVDEYQDTNILQGELLDELSAQHRNLMAVGDDAQSIYSWRGANFANILDFPRRHPTAQVFHIETNYRSTPEILAVANAAIAGNTRQFPKALQAVRRSGPKPGLVSCYDPGEQASFIAQRVQQLQDEGRSLQQICVLYRSHFHALELQMELTRRGIPFLITSGIRFFEQAHIKDVAAYLKLITNPRDELAFRRLVRMLPGVGPKSADRIWNQFRATENIAATVDTPRPKPVALSDNDGAIGEEDVTSPLVPTEPVAPRLRAVSSALPKKATASWAQMVETIAQCEAPALVHQPAEIIRLVLAAEYREYLKMSFDNAARRLEEIGQLAQYAEQFRDVHEFLAQLALQTNLEAEAEAQALADPEQRLRLSTVHQAKGLEFEVVFVPMLCEGSFPAQWTTESAEDLEEERRLFYVAVTRAKDELYLSYPMRRMLQGLYQASPPSRFLSEIPPELLEAWRLHGYDTPFAVTEFRGNHDDAEGPF